VKIDEANEDVKGFKERRISDVAELGISAVGFPPLKIGFMDELKKMGVEASEARKIATKIDNIAVDYFRSDKWKNAVKKILKANKIQIVK
jgi:hypothetical protein